MVKELKTIVDTNLPSMITDFLASHFDMIKQTQELMDVTLITQAAYNQAITPGYLKRSQIKENMRSAMSVGVGLKIIGMPFTWKELASWFGVDGRRLRIDFFKVSKCKAPKEVLVRSDDGNIEIEVEGQVRTYIPLKLPFARHYPPPNMESYLEEFARRIRQEELSKPGYELYQRYLYRTKGGGLGGVNAQTLGAALLYSASKLRGGKLRMTYLSEKLKVSYEPLVKMVNKIEDVMAEWRMS